MPKKALRKSWRREKPRAEPTGRAGGTASIRAQSRGAPSPRGVCVHDGSSSAQSSRKGQSHARAECSKALGVVKTWQEIATSAQQKVAELEKALIVQKKLRVHALRRYTLMKDQVAEIEREREIS